MEQLINKSSKIITLANGVVLEISPHPRSRILREIGWEKPPSPPVVTVDDKGHTEENPDDPAYQQTLQDFQLRMLVKARNAVLVFAAKVVSVPEGVPTVESDEWIETAEALGMEVKREPKALRLLDWLDFCAILTRQDEKLVNETLSSVAGTREREVAAAEAGFRSDEGSDEPQGMPVDEVFQQRDSDDGSADGSGSVL